MALVIMLISAAAIIGLVRFGLIAGLDHLAGAHQWGAKLRGQATGYATSTPELVTLVAAGLAGVWDAGLWNIAASNLINTVLMASAVLFYGQLRDFATWRFLDEIGFAALAVAAHQASVSRRQRTLRTAHRNQQRRNAGRRRTDR